MNIRPQILPYSSHLKVQINVAHVHDPTKITNQSHLVLRALLFQSQGYTYICTILDLHEGSILPCEMVCDGRPRDLSGYMGLPGTARAGSFVQYYAVRLVCKSLHYEIGTSWTVGVRVLGMYAQDPR